MVFTFHSKSFQEKKQERKAAKTLSFILLVFLITWTPYNVLAVMKAILPPQDQVMMMMIRMLRVTYRFLEKKFKKKCHNYQTKAVNKASAHYVMRKIGSRFRYSKSYSLFASSFFPPPPHHHRTSRSKAVNEAADYVNEQKMSSASVSSKFYSPLRGLSNSVFFS